MTEKRKILTIGDHPLSPSGVGTQTKYIVEALLKTGRYKVISLAGAIKHHNYQPQRTEEWGEDWIIYPTDGYGNKDIVRSLIRNERPDMLWFMTDPRFYVWLWEMEDEIRPLIPMMYYHVWDNYPLPKFNKRFYDSTDVVVNISKVTHQVVSELADKADVIYHPHSVDTEIFKKLEPEVLEQSMAQLAGNHGSDRVRFFWNNRNARRKQSGTLIFWFKEFLDRVGHDKAQLIMHTDPKDVNGQDLEAIVHELELGNGQVLFSVDKLAPEQLAVLYNMVDCTINISDAEGFGLSTLESLASETPIIVNMTGGLQEQVTDGEEWFGIGIEPASKSIIGSQDIPWIYEDRLSKEDFVSSMEKMYKMSKEERAELGQKGRQHVLNNYNFENYGQRWVEIVDEACEKYGSWGDRKNYNSWRIEKL